MDKISRSDIEILRDLARTQLEFAHKPENIKKIEQRKALNDFRSNKPLIHLEVGTFADEVLTPLQRCESEFARGIERSLLGNFINQKLFDDDTVTPDCFRVGTGAGFKFFNHAVTAEFAVDSSGREIGRKFDYFIKNLKEDLPKLERTEIVYDKTASEEYHDRVQDIIGDILPVKYTTGALYSVPTQEIVHMMGMENMMFAMYDYPEEFKELINIMADDTIRFFRFLEDNKLLTSTKDGEGLGNGSFCYTDELPDNPVTTKDVWGFMDSQETVGISPEMFEEFIFPAYKRISDCYGFLSYGCCEPVDPIWDNCLSKLDNLRKISISPWANEEFMGERLRGKKIIYFRKPSPNYLGVGENLDEEALKAHINKTLRAARGCQLEIAQRDVYTINNDVNKAKRYVGVVRECIEENWR